jgi:hypothetical protein
MEQFKGQTGKGKGEMKGFLKDTLLEIVRPEDILAGIPVPQKGQQPGGGGRADDHGGGKGDHRGRKGKGKQDHGRNGSDARNQQEEARWPQQEDQRWAMPQQQQQQEVPWYPSGGMSYPFVMAGDGRAAGAGDMAAFNPFFPPSVQLAQIPAWTTAKGVQVMQMGQWPQGQGQVPGIPVAGGAPDPKNPIGYPGVVASQIAQAQAAQSMPQSQSKDKGQPKERKAKQNQKGGADPQMKSRQEPRVRRERPDVEVEPAMDESLRTSIMLRNIPNKYTQRMLLSVVHELGFNQECFDFFYLPIDFRNKCNVGYAFINFLSNGLAKRFFKALDGYQLRAFNSDKVCAVAWARVQGLQANIEHYRNSPIAGVPIPQYRPLLFDNGVERTLPEPDGPLARVRLRVPKGAPAQRKNRFKNNGGNSNAAPSGD